MAESKRIVITGGARGIGRAMARYLTAKHHRVFLIDVDENELKYCVHTHLGKPVPAAPVEEEQPQAQVKHVVEPAPLTNGDHAPVADTHDHKPETNGIVAPIVEPVLTNGNTPEVNGNGVHHHHETSEKTAETESAPTLGDAIPATTAPAVESTPIELPASVPEPISAPTPATATATATAAAAVPTLAPTAHKGAPPGAVDYAVVDLRDHEGVRAAITKAANFFGGQIDVLVNNAGIARAQFTRGRSMEDTSVLDEWRAYLEVNLTAPFVVAQAVIPYMKVADERRLEHVHAVIRPEAMRQVEKDVANSAKAQALAAKKEEDVVTKETVKEVLGNMGEEKKEQLIEEKIEEIFDEHKGYTGDGNQAGPIIINIASFRAHQSEPNCEGYASSKGGILGLTQSMSISCAQWGIRCNAILPGYISVEHENSDADKSGRIWAHGTAEERHRAHPVGRIGYGEDVARTVEWLMDAGFVTGQEIIVDGGVNKIKHPMA